MPPQFNHLGFLVEMLQSSNTAFEVKENDNKTVELKVQSSPTAARHDGCYSTWNFTEEGALIGVSHWKS